MAKITGRVEVLVNGQLLLNKEGAVASNISVSGTPVFERQEVLGDTGLHGFKEVPQIAMLEVTVTDRDDVSLSSLLGITDGTVIFRAAGGGKVYTMNNAFCTGIANVTAGDGETPLVFKGANWTESTE